MQTVSLELAKTLKAAGVEQCSCFAWGDDDGTGPQLLFWGYLAVLAEPPDWWSAYTSDELLALLGEDFGELSYMCELYKAISGGSGRYFAQEETPAEALGKLLLAVMTGRTAHA